MLFYVCFVLCASNPFFFFNFCFLRKVLERLKNFIGVMILLWEVPNVTLNYFLTYKVVLSNVVQ